MYRQLGVQTSLSCDDGDFSGINGLGDVEGVYR